MNKLVNKSDFPFIPCCYGPKNHADVVGTKYRHYFYGEALPEKDIPAQNLILTNKFVGIDKFGTIPKRINKLLSIFTDLYLVFLLFILLSVFTVFYLVFLLFFTYSSVFTVFYLVFLLIFT